MTKPIIDDPILDLLLITLSIIKYGKLNLKEESNK